MTDSVKATLDFASNKVTLDGPTAFVAGCVDQFPKQPAEDRTSQFLFEQSIEHAWDWFALHANQRMQGVNFFLLAAAFLTSAYVSAMQYSRFVVAVGVAVLGVWFCIVFYAFELRIRELIKTGEKALERAQNKLSNTTGIKEFEICALVEKPRYRMTSYHKVILSLYGLTCATFLVGIGYALHLASPEIHIFGSYLTNFSILMYRAMFILAALMCLFWAQRLVRSAQERPVATYVVSVALALTGGTVLIVSAIGMLR